MTKKSLATAIILALITVSFSGCIRRTTVDVHPGTTTNTGAIVLDVNLIVTLKSLEPAVAKSLTPLTAAQWTGIINAKASQVTSMDINLVEKVTGRVEYAGNDLVSGAQTETTLNDVKPGNYTLTIGFKGNGLDEWIFSDAEDITVTAGKITTVDMAAALDNFCEKKIKLTGMDATVAQTTTPTLEITNDSGAKYTITGTKTWSATDPTTMMITFPNNLAFDINQPALLKFLKSDNSQAASMSLSFDPIAIAGWDLSLPFVSADAGGLDINVHAVPPVGVVIPS